jgi:transposase-like protein
VISFSLKKEKTMTKEEPMRSVIEVGQNGKKKREKYIKMTEEINSRIEVIQMLIPIGLQAVNDVLQWEVTQLVGKRYERPGREKGMVRWGKQASSVYLADQKVSVLAPRLRDRLAGEEIPLTSLQPLRVPRSLDEGLLRKLLGGLSCRNYEACAEAVPGAFALSASTVSRRYIRASARKLQAFMERKLDTYEFVALFLDGKTFGDDEMVIAVGVTTAGEKVILGFVQTATENEAVCTRFLGELVARGLQYEEGLLVVIDGAKGLRKAVDKVWGEKAIVQRCQWHKRENVLSYLTPTQQEAVKPKLQAAYEQPSYEAAKGALLSIRRELNVINLSAVRSLDEGLEETLTLHRLGLFTLLGTSFKTTNLIESINAQLGQRTDKVDYWKNSYQKERWIATALLDIEPRLRKVKGYQHLLKLKTALKEVTTQKNHGSRSSNFN